MNVVDNISILIVAHNHADYIEELLKSLNRFNYTNVFFCDAASTDGTLDILMNSSFSANVLPKTTLESFSKNNNDLIRHFKLNSKYYLLLNPDTYFDVNFIEILYSKIETNSEIGIVAPTLKYPNGKIQVTWKRFPSLLNVVKKRLGLLKSMDEIQMIGPEIDWCLGACMLINKSLLKSDNNLLDERYRLYCEDIDICFEAHTKGQKVIGLTETYVFHHLNETSAKKICSRYNLWNISSIFKFIFKWNFKYFFK